MKTRSRRIVTVIALVILQVVMPLRVSYALTTTVSQEAAPFSLPDGRVGQSYEYQLRSEGGLPPLIWRVVSGELPAGISLEPSGKLKGVPTTPRRDAFGVVIEVSDSSQTPQTFAQPFLLMIQAAPLRIVTNPSKLRIMPPKASSSSNDAVKPELADVDPAQTSVETTTTAEHKPDSRTNVSWPYIASPPRSPIATTEMTTSTAMSKGDSTARPPADKNTPDSGRADNLDPAKFVRIYEAPKNRNQTSDRYGKLIYDPSDGDHNKRTTRLDADLSSTIIVVPDWGMMNFDMPLNNLYINAELASGDSKTNLEVVGYSEIGKAENAALAQQGMAFQSTKNVVTMVLDLANTAGEIGKAFYPGTTSARVAVERWTNRDKDIDSRIKELQELFRLYKPEIQTMGTFFQDRKNLNLVEIIGTEVFWVDRATLQAIASQYLKNLSDAFDGNVKPDQQQQAVKEMLYRTFLVLGRLKDAKTEIDILQEDIGKFKEFVNKKEFVGGTKELVDRLKIVQGEIPRVQAEIRTLSEREKAGTITGDEKLRKGALERQEGEFKGLALSLAVQIYSLERARIAFGKLERLFAPGYISLDSARAKDGDRLTIKVEARGSDVEGPGIPALFEVTVKKFGVKFHIGSSFMFIKRLGLTEADLHPPDPTPDNPNDPLPPGLKEINFAPSPGMTMGVTWFKRGDRGADKFLRALAPTFGVNVSFMNFNDPGFDLSTGKFTNTTGTDVQVGAGPVFSLFNNKLHFSYGWNLNVDRRRNYFGVGFGFLEIADFLKNKLKE